MDDDFVLRLKEEDDKWVANALRGMLRVYSSRHSIVELEALKERCDALFSKVLASAT